MGLSMMACNAQLYNPGQDVTSTLNQQVSEDKPLGLMTLYFLGFVFILLGLAQHYGRIDLLPHSLSFNYSGLVIAVTGLAMTLPFLAWSLKASATALDKISA